jgi:ATP-dependent Clp protease ATP-binding subunit ClpC
LIVDLSSKYILDKQFPDKAIDIMDQAGSKVKIKNIERPQKAKDIENQLEQLALEESRIQSSGSLLSKIEDEQINLLEQYDQVITQWAAKTMKAIYEVLSSRTGVPISDISKKDSEKMLGLFKNLNNKIVGQTEALSEISESILRSKSGLQDANKPVGSFLLVGASGTGKTYTAKCIAEFIYGSMKSLIQLDMSEYSEKISSSRLIGASPGYVGYEEGGELTEKVRRNPYSVILFDEVEKAHPEVLNILLQILEEGILTDNSGRKIDFSNCIIILTGNIGSEKAAKPNIGFGTSDGKEEAKNKLKAELKTFFRPEFLNRLNDIILFNDFDLSRLIEITKLEFKKLSEKLKEKKIKLSTTTSLVKYIADEAIKEKMGARPIKRLIQKNIENELSKLILSKSLPEGASVKFSYIKSQVKYEIKELEA